MMDAFEKASREFVNAPCGWVCKFCINDKITCRFYNNKESFEAGAEWREKELTRWHDPQEELPEDMEVLCMTDRQSNTYEVMRHDKHGWWMHVPIQEGGWCACDCNVIRWREIYENE